MTNAEASIQGLLPVSQVDVKERFYRHFQQECTQLQEQIAALESISLVGGEKQDAIAHILGGITSLSNEVLDSTGFLPAYDQATYSRVSHYPSFDIIIFTHPTRLSKRSKRLYKRPELNLPQKQDSNSRLGKRTARRYQSTMQQN